MKTKVFSFLFAIIFVIQLYAIYTDSNALETFFKPLIAITLLVWLFVSTNLKGRFNKQIFTGLTFALLGDVFLIYQNVYEGFFMYSLIAFFLCHIFYIRAFILDHKSNTNYKTPYFLWIVGAGAIFCSGLFFYLQPQLGGMQFPVLMYALIVTIMAIMAVNRYGKVNILSFKLILIGSLFFLLSDTVLAVNKFAQPIPESGALVMATYMIAQFLIVYGTITRKLIVTRTEI